MPISIQCDNCQRAYNVDDKLAGKTVKCKNCAALIRIPGAVTLEGTSDDCLACGKPMPKGARVCTACGFNRTTGQREMTFLDAQIAENKALTYKQQKWVRQPGSHLLETIDQLIKVLCLLVLLAGVALTTVHIVHSPVGFSFTTLLPTLVVLGMFALIMAPLATLAVNSAVRAMKIAPREDTYSRLLTCMLLPFIVSLLAGWPDLAKTWDWAIPVGWLAGIGLLIYFFRSEMVEWGASLGAAALAILLSLIFVNIGDSLLIAANGPLYGDMLPSGPWTSLATGHSPDPVAKTVPVALAPAPIADTPVAVVASVPVTPATRVAAAPTVVPAIVPTPAPTESAPQVAINNTTPPTVTSLPATRAARPALAVGPAIVDSPFFAKGKVTDGTPDFANIRNVVVPTGTVETMLTLKESDTSVDVQRWTLNPLEKKERVNGISYYAQKPAVFSLAPKGESVVDMTFFPRRQLEITYFDNKTARKVLPVDDVRSYPTDAVASFPGYLDANRFCLRWDYNRATILQIVNTLTGQEIRHFNIDVALPASDAIVISPNGKIAAIYGSPPATIAAPNVPRNQLIILNMDTGLIQRRISVTDLTVRFLGMAFSPDHTQIAFYGAVNDLPTLMTFKIATGEIPTQALLSQEPLARTAETPPHPLLWLPGCQSLLLNGNELISPLTGKKFATLGLVGIVDQQLIGGSTLALIVRNPDNTTRLALAELDDLKLREAASQSK